MTPGGEAVARAPYNGLPAPHLLLGYQFMHRVLNDYLFENRVFMQLGFDRPPGQRPQRLYWTCLTDCSYALNVGEYMRFLDLDNFHGTFAQMHNAVLMDRVAADMGRAHLRGRGIHVGTGGRVWPADEEEDEAAAARQDREQEEPAWRRWWRQQEGAPTPPEMSAGRMRPTATTMTSTTTRTRDDTALVDSSLSLNDQLLSSTVSQNATSLSGSGALGLHDEVVRGVSSEDDAVLLAAIRRLRVALCHYMFCYAFDRFDTEQTYRFLPGSEVFDDDDWLVRWVDAFADLDTQQLVRAVAEDPEMLLEEPAETMAKCLLSTLAGADDPEEALRGGAYRLRSRRIPNRTGLRPRDSRGRAITLSRIRLRRPNYIWRFIDQLPRRTRRPRPPGAPPARPAAPPPPVEEDEEMPELEEPWQEEEVRRAERVRRWMAGEPYEESPEAEPEPEEIEGEQPEEETFYDEVVRTVLQAIDALQNELGPVASRHRLFRFTTDFYRTLLRVSEDGMLSASLLRKWVLYFFLAEHIASTLYYLYSWFVAHAEFRRYVDCQTLQVLIVGWDVNAQQVFKRIWSEQSSPATIFETLWARIIRDFLMMVERTGQFEGMDEVEQHMFLSDIQYRDKSGDVEEVLKQLNLSEELIDSIDISFRIRFRGIVAITTNQRIRGNLQRVLAQRGQQARAAQQAWRRAHAPED
nr:terminal protein precursor [Tawny frogmouth aviadenovirus A]